jgi:hypothetical protein
MTADIRDALTPLADAFEALGVNYRIGGSVASSALGVGRTTLDVDLVADLRVQASALDRAYLDRWARELAVDDLLARAWSEAGVA